MFPETHQIFWCNEFAVVPSLLIQYDMSHKHCCIVLSPCCALDHKDTAFCYVYRCAIYSYLYLEKTILFSFSSGFASNLNFLWVPKVVQLQQHTSGVVVNIIWLQWISHPFHQLKNFWNQLRFGKVRVVSLFTRCNGSSLNLFAVTVVIDSLVSVLFHSFSSVWFVHLNRFFVSSLVVSFVFRMVGNSAQRWLGMTYCVLHRLWSLKKNVNYKAGDNR